MQVAGVLALASRVLSGSRVALPTGDDQGCNGMGTALLDGCAAENRRRETIMLTSPGCPGSAGWARMALEDVLVKPFRPRVTAGALHRNLSRGP